MGLLLAQTDSFAGGVPIIDGVVIGVYFAVVMAAGILPVLGKRMTGDAYFLAGRSLKWPIVGAALFASNISTIHLVGLAEGGFKDGMVIGNFEWMASLTLIGLSLIFAPFYFQTKIATLPEYLERRYHPLARSIMAFLAIMAALLIHIGISLYAGAEVFQLFFGIDPLYSILLVSLMTAVYTVIGGLTAVVVTETLQTVILLIGAVMVTFLAATQLPEAGIDSWSSLREAVGEKHLSMIHTETVVEASGAEPEVVPQPYPFVWYAFLLGYPVLGVWYWCTDQTIVQRVLGAHSQHAAQRGALFAGLLKVLPPFLMVLPGVFAYAVFRDEINALEGGATQTLPFLIDKLVPVGWKGLIAAALLAALMSTIAAALNSTGSLVALDIVSRFRPETTDRQQVLIGRVSATVVMLLAMAWSTQGDKFGSIFEAINKMPAQFLAPPIATVFVWGLFWRRGTTAAAIATLLAGFSVGIVVFVLDLPLITLYEGPKMIDGAVRVVPLQLVSDVWGIPFMMQAWWGFCLCSVLYIAVSLATPPPSAEQVEGLVWKNPLACVLDGRWTGPADPRLLSLALAALMIVLYVNFG